MNQLPLMYTQLAPWWPLLSTPEEYVDEADYYRKILLEYSVQPPRTLLELGSGGGNNASHLKKSFALTLVDLSAGMLAASQKINPECDHILGDMRTVRLAAQFDAVFVHDAIMYMITEEDLLRVFLNAARHCKPSGVALFCPDETSEIFAPFTDHGGTDAPDGRGLRYLEWSYDPDPGDHTYFVDFAYMLHEPGQPTQVYYDRHELGLFSRATWMALIKQAGFEPHLLLDVYQRDLFLGVRT